MDWRAALRDRLVTNATVAGLVGSRVYIGLRPQGSTLPAVVIVIVSDERPNTMRAEDYPPGRVQFDCWANDSKTSWDVAEAVLAATTPAVTWQGHKFAHAVPDMGLRDLTEMAGGVPAFRVTFDAIFYHTPV